MKRGLLLSILCALAIGLLHAQEARETAFPRATYPEYVVFLPQSEIDSVYYSHNTSIIPVVFRVNKYNLVPNRQLDSIVQVLHRIQVDPAVRIACVWIGGSASPEGPKAWNYRLGEYRSQALARYLAEEAGFPRDQMEVVNLWEDWYSFEVALENGAQIPHKEEVMKILRTEPDNERRKRKIMALDKGYTWHRIIRDVFPPFRNARMAIVCYEQPRDLPAEPQLLPLCDGIPAPRPVQPAAVNPVSVAEPRKWHLAVKTNLLFLAAATANAGVEVELWPHGTLDIPVWYSPYDITPTRKLRLLATQPELRWWPGQVMQGHFIGLHTHVVGFNVAVNDKGRYQDPNHALWGMGLSYGYALSWGKQKQWGVEFNIGVGFAEYDYDVYQNRKDGQLFRSGSDFYWGVTRAGISLSYKWAFPRKK